jgi:hypothetical protein
MVKKLRKEVMTRSVCARPAERVPLARLNLVYLRLADADLTAAFRGIGVAERSTKDEEHDGDGEGGKRRCVLLSGIRSDAGQ